MDKTAVVPAIPSLPSAAAPDGILRQSDAPLPHSVLDHVFIYRLLDPRTGAPCYIGYTKQPRVRLIQHRKDSKQMKSAHLPVYTWWRVVTARKESVEPIMQVITEPIHVSKGPDAEVMWAKRHREEGWNLLNARGCGGGCGNGSHWTEQKMKQAIIELARELHLKGSYPTYKQFLDNGHAALYRIVKGSSGGHPSMAKKLKMTRPGRTKRMPWTIASAKAEIIALNERLHLGECYPAASQFRNNGLSGLYIAISKWPGGHDGMATNLGLRTQRLHRAWNRQGAEEELFSLIAELGLEKDLYPTPEQFYDHGRRGLYQVISLRFGGHRQMASELGLEMQKRRWSLREAKMEVTKLVNDLGLGPTYPMRKDFHDRGLTGLYSAIGHRLGGHEKFASELHLRGPKRTKWTREEAEDAISRLAHRLSKGSRYPTLRQFRAHGHGGLYRTVYDRFGGHSKMAEDLGLKRLPMPS